MALAHKYRLSKKASPYLFKADKQRKASSLFTLIYNQNQLNRPRLAVSVSKKIDLKATTRNRIKRAIHEALKTILGTTTVLPYDVLIRPQKQILNQKQLQITSDLYQLFNKAGITKEKRC